MKRENDQRQSSLDDLRAARLAGFTAALAHLSESRRQRLIDRYLELDARRTRLISQFLVAIVQTD